MSAMVDKAVQALSDDTIYSWRDLSPEQVVRLVIEAMRLPTVAMEEAGNAYTDWGNGAGDAWTAMVDEILKDKPIPSTIGKGLDDAITDELEHGPKPIMKG